MNHNNIYVLSLCESQVIKNLMSYQGTFCVKTMTVNHIYFCVSIVKLSVLANN